MNERHYNVIIAYENVHAVRQIEQLCAGGPARFVSWAASGSALLLEVEKYQDSTPIDVVLLAPTIQGFNAALIEDLLYHQPQPIAVIGLLPPLEARTQELYAAGMLGHVALPVDPGQARRLLELLSEVVDKALAKRETEVFTPLAPSMATVGALQWQRMSLALYGTGGGVGKTSLAINLAAALAVLGNAKTLLLDLDMTRGAVAPRLGLNPERNLFGLVGMALPEYQRAQQQGLSYTCPAAMLSEYTQRALGGRLHVLAGLPNMRVGGNAEFRDDPARTRAIIKAIIETGRQKYDFVVLDLGPDIHNDVHFAALERADLVLTVVRPDVADIQSTAQIVPDLQQVFGQADKFELVINQWTPEAGIKLGELVKVIGMRKFAEVPYDPTYSLSGNLQKPFILDAKPNPTSDAIVGMAARFFPAVTPQWQKRGGQVDGRLPLVGPTRRSEAPLGRKLAALFRSS